MSFPFSYFLTTPTVSRAILETAAAIVHLDEKLETLTTDASEDGFHAILDELHGTVARGRYPWHAWGDSEAMAEFFSVYRAGKDPDLPSEQRAGNILTMIQRLDRRVAVTARAALPCSTQVWS
jgi:hypothetical protein